MNQKVSTPSPPQNQRYPCGEVGEDWCEEAMSGVVELGRFVAPPPDPDRRCQREQLVPQPPANPTLFFTPQKIVQV